MPKDKTPAPAGIEGWLSKLFGGPETKADKSLDKVKMAVQADLEKLKGSTDIAVLFYQRAEEGFKKDLDELGISGEEQAPHLAAFKAEWDKMEMGKRAKEILDSSELSAMDGFITTIGNLPKLKEAIESSEPQSALESLLGGITGKVPGLSEFLKSGGLDSILTALGLGFLVSGKKDKGKEKEGAKEKKGETKKEEGKNKDSAEPEIEAEEGMIEVPESYKSGKTLIIGDSNNAVLTAPPHKALRDRLNADKMLAKGGEQTSWGLARIKEQPPEYYKDLEYVIVGFGSNDITGPDSAEAIWGRLKQIVDAIKEKTKDNNPNIKILIATIPPRKGDPPEGPAFKTMEAKRIELNRLIKAAQKRGEFTGVIDHAAKKSEGGLADENDTESLAKDYRKFSDDLVHASADVLAKALRRGQYRFRTTETGTETVTQTA